MRGFVEARMKKNNPIAKSIVSTKVDVSTVVFICEKVGSGRREMMRWGMVVKFAVAALVGVAAACYLFFPAPLRVAKTELQRVDGVWKDSGGQPFTGWMTEQYKEGQLLSEVPLDQGVAQGWARSWHPNGQLEMEEYFEQGKSHGTRRRYHANGNLRSVAEIEHGVMQGTFEEYHENEQLAARMKMVNGLADGVAEAWHADGRLKAEAQMSKGETVSVKHFP